MAGHSQFKNIMHRKGRQDAAKAKIFTKLIREITTAARLGSPDPAANPYLAFAAMLMAGLDGVLNRINPGEPLDKDIYDLSPEEMKSVPSMPGSLDEALTCLEDDHAFLMRGDVFTEELIETFIDYKRKNEAEAVRLRPHPYEFALYYDI